jgi:hypothetical protein
MITGQVSAIDIGGTGSQCSVITACATIAVKMV